MGLSFGRPKRNERIETKLERRRNNRVLLAVACALGWLVVDGKINPEPNARAPRYSKSLPSEATKELACIREAALEACNGNGDDDWLDQNCAGLLARADLAATKRAQAIDLYNFTKAEAERTGDPKLAAEANALYQRLKTSRSNGYGMVEPRDAALNLLTRERDRVVRAHSLNEREVLSCPGYSDNPHLVSHIEAVESPALTTDRRVAGLEQ